MVKKMYIHGNLLLFVKKDVYSQCHADLLKCIEQNVNKV